MLIRCSSSSLNGSEPSSCHDLYMVTIHSSKIVTRMATDIKCTTTLLHHQVSVLELLNKYIKLIEQPTTTLNISLLRYINLLRTGRKSIQSKIGLRLQRLPPQQMFMAERLQARCKMYPSTHLQRFRKTLLQNHLSSHQGGECFRG